MNKKGQTAIYILFSLIVFGLVWLTGLATMVADIGQTFVQTNNLTGIDGFFYSNLNLVIGVFYLIALVAAGRALA